MAPFTADNNECRSVHRKKLILVATATILLIGAVAAGLGAGLSKGGSWGNKDEAKSADTSEENASYAGIAHAPVGGDQQLQGVEQIITAQRNLQTCSAEFEGAKTCLVYQIGYMGNTAIGGCASCIQNLINSGSCSDAVFEVCQASIDSCVCGLCELWTDKYLKCTRGVRCSSNTCSVGDGPASIEAPEDSGTGVAQSTSAETAGGGETSTPDKVAAGKVCDSGEDCESGSCAFIDYNRAKKVCCGSGSFSYRRKSWLTLHEYCLNEAPIGANCGNGNFGESVDKMCKSSACAAGVCSECDSGDDCESGSCGYIDYDRAKKVCCATGSFSYQRRSWSVRADYCLNEAPSGANCGNFKGYRESIDNMCESNACSSGFCK